MKTIFLILLFSVSTFSFAEEKPKEIDLAEIQKRIDEQLPTTTSRWKLAGEYTTIIRDPIEQISINEDCHPLDEKNCEVNKALKKYLTIEASDEIKILFQDSAETRPGVIVCRDLLNGNVLIGEKPNRGRFPSFKEFCQFSDNSFISVNSLAFYQGPQQIPVPETEENSENESSSAPAASVEVQ